MPVSGRPTLRLRGDLSELSAGGASWFALHLLACLLACVKGHFARLFSSLFSLSTLPLVSIWSGKYSTDWVQCDGAFGGGRSQGCHGYLLPRASLLPGSTNLFRHHLPSSSIVDEFNCLCWESLNSCRHWEILFKFIFQEARGGKAL